MSFHLLGLGVWRLVRRMLGKKYHGYFWSHNCLHEVKSWKFQQKSNQMDDLPKHHSVDRKLPEMLPTADVEINIVLNVFTVRGNILASWYTEWFPSWLVPHVAVMAFQEQNWGSLTMVCSVNSHKNIVIGGGDSSPDPPHKRSAQKVISQHLQLLNIFNMETAGRADRMKQWLIVMEAFSDLSPVLNCKGSSSKWNIIWFI